MLCYVTNRRRWILFQHLFTVNEYHTPLFTTKLVTEKHENKLTTRMWANAQPDGRPAEYRWRPLFNAAKFG